MLALALPLLLPAAAQDGGLDLSGVDLSGADIGGPELMTYSGGLLEKAPELAPGKPVRITHSGGTVSVRCQDATGLSAQLSYTLEGSDGPALEAMGAGIGLRAWGDEGGGGVQSQVPWKPASVTRADVPLVVTLGREAELIINNRGGWIEVLNCRGTVTASTDQGGIFASGVYSAFSLSSGTGDVTLKAGEGSEITGSSRAVANTGSVLVQLPLTISGRITATGSEVAILHAVDGTVTPTSASGTIGAGGHNIYLQARDRVELSTPQ